MTEMFSQLRHKFVEVEGQISNMMDQSIISGYILNLKMARKLESKTKFDHIFLAWLAGRQTVNSVSFVKTRD
jgi:hypothetical protein